MESLLNSLSRMPKPAEILRKIVKDVLVKLNSLPRPPLRQPLILPCPNAPQPPPWMHLPIDASARGPQKRS